MDRITGVSTNPILDAQQIDNVTIAAINNGELVLMQLYLFPKPETQEVLNALAMNQSQAIRDPNDLSHYTSRPQASDLTLVIKTHRIPLTGTPTLTTVTPEPVLLPVSAPMSASSPPVDTTISVPALPDANPVTISAPPSTSTVLASSPKLQSEAVFAPILNTIQQSSYGANIYNEILNHPDLKYITIRTPAQSAAERERLGLDPMAQTTLSLDENGQLSADIVMDPDVIATVMTPDGQALQVGADEILFHELAHIYLELNDQIDHSQSNWDVMSETLASQYEGTYGGYQRDYYNAGGHVSWA